MFKDKVVWITGASSGIGLAFAEAMHAEGAKLILSALTEDELKPVAERLTGSVPIAFDVADFDKLPALVEKAVAAFGRIDVLVNNAGITQRDEAKDTSFAVYRRLIDIDLMAPIALTQLVLPHMIRQGSGRLIVMASIAGKFGAPLRTAYSAAKHGIFGYFDALRTEVGHRGIEVHVIAPGSVRTNLARNALTGEGKAFGKTDDFIEGGYDPAYLIDRALCDIKRGKREIVIVRGLEGKMVTLRRFFPELSFKIMLKKAPAFLEEFHASK
ncbi:SDR family NAD(P)-dependent oxidoreductase [Ruegeria jejuensis]|uniref:SDR family NAD(P)-dependent oxidoreductase n=1 Tax=Ruegeria jejuensis TaxID=3233338 RepID=UPI00355BEA25